MKSLLSVFIFIVAVCHVYDIYTVGDKEIPKYLKVTVFYESLGLDYLNIYKSMVDVLEDKKLAPHVHFELVPFGKAHYERRPYYVVCEHGRDECDGNIMNTCFFDKHHEKIEQVKFLHCCMTAPSPPHAGKACAKKLGYNFDKVERCINGPEGHILLESMANRTLDFKPTLTTFPSIAFNNVYTVEDQIRAVADLKAVIIEKLMLRETKG